MWLTSWKMSKWIRLAGILLIFVLLLTAAGCGGAPEPDPDDNGTDPDENDPDDLEPISPPTGRGNRPGHYDALALEADGWIYYTHFPYDQISRVRLDGTESGTVSTDTGASSLNRLGEWLAYTCDAGLVRVRPDGTEREVIYAQPTPYLLRYMSYVDGYYFLAKLQEGQPEQGILRIPFGGGEPLQISSDAPAGGMCVAGGYVYYSTGIDGTVYRMGIDGSSREALAAGFHPVVEGNYLYYAFENRVVRRDLTSGEEQGLTLDLYGNSFQVSDDWIYYTHAEDDLHLHRASWGGGTEKVVADPVWKAFLYDSGILFQHHDTWKIYRVPSGSDRGLALP